MVDLSQAPDMDRFSGDNPLEWVIQTEKYFIFYDILLEHKLSWASFYLDGEALKCTIPNFPSPQSWNVPSDYNKVKSAHQVFDEKSNKTPDIVVDVENATMLIKSDSAEMLDTQAKEKIFHSISDETKEEAEFPIPQHVSKPLVYNNEAHKVFDEFSVGCKDVILESRKVLTITTYTIKENDYAIDVGNEDKNEEEEVEEEEKLFTIENKIQLVPAFVGILPLWIDSTFSTFGDFAMFNMLHKLGITRCLEEMSEMLSTCRYDQLINRGIIDHFSRLGHASLILTLHLFPPDQFGLAFPFDPGSRSLTMFLRVTRNYVFCVALDNLDHNKLIMSILWNSCIWVGKGQEQCLPGILLPKSREFGRAEKMQGLLGAFAARYSEQFSDILVNKDDVLLLTIFGVVHISKTTLSYLGFGPGPYLAYDIFAKLPGKTMDVFRQQLYLDEELAPQRTD
ncbi:hypothetical protein KY285_021571 [Solanum tuberosum]|nr:hypothetical protein KY289_021831 [Solanum tuberosum]KAH0694474.1 hypothetical protein KY285_021571 [Solanum tuberosum]